ncbi:MAG: peptidase M52 [Gammaproteobacteria bacterium]|nr:MAG: peptidase M52 [Gammaproteobacteria bacterium]
MKLIAKNPTLILGVGNKLLTDEGIGNYVIEYLKNNKNTFILQNIKLLDGGTLSFPLAIEVQKYESLIVVDSAMLHKKAGSVGMFENDDLDSFISSSKKSSVHEVGLTDILKIALLSDKLPQNRALIGVQPKTIDWGDQPNQVILDSMDTIIETISQLLAKWHK